MAQINQFGSAAPGQGGSTRDCLRYEAMLADVIDGTLSAEDQAAFDRHRETCDSCSVMLEDARRGADWLDLLRSDPPVPSARLVDRILAETSVRAAQEAEAARAAHRAATEAASLLGHASSPSPAVSSFAAEPGKVLSFRSRVPAPLRPALNTVLQTRFAMTAAMAFFSVALTLNLTGVRLSELHARDLRPASLRRSFYEANAHVVRYYENLRVVYELESRVRDLQRSSEPDPAPAPAKSAEPTDRKGDGSTPADQPAPAGKPHSGLPSGSDRRESQETTSPLLRPGEQPALSRRYPVVTAPRGSVIPVSFSSNSPDRQKRGSV